MSILTIILALMPLIIQLIELLMKRKKSGRGLSQREYDKLADVMGKLKEAQKAAADLGVQ